MFAGSNYTGAVLCCVLWYLKLTSDHYINGSLGLLCSVWQWLTADFQNFKYLGQSQIWIPQLGALFLAGFFLAISRFDGSSKIMIGRVAKNTKMSKIE